jgi:hypothetical protein
MHQQLAGMDNTTKSWIGTTYLPEAMHQLDTFANHAAQNPAVRTVFLQFWQMALISYVEGTLLSENSKKLDEKLILRALHGGASYNQVQSQYVALSHIKPFHCIYLTLYHS